MYTVVMESELVVCMGFSALEPVIKTNELLFPFIFRNHLFCLIHIFLQPHLVCANQHKGLVTSEGYHVIITSNILVNNPVGKQTVHCLINSPTLSVGSGRHTRIYENAC